MGSLTKAVYKPSQAAEEVNLNITLESFLRCGELLNKV
jgi:hypothetical protein